MIIMKRAWKYDLQEMPKLQDFAYKVEAKLFNNVYIYTIIKTITSGCVVLISKRDYLKTLNGGKIIWEVR
jgi:hypothetical protein